MKAEKTLSFQFLRYFPFSFPHLTYYTAYQVDKKSKVQKLNATFTITAGVIVIRIRILSRSRHYRRFMAIYTLRQVVWIILKQLVH